MFFILGFIAVLIAVALIFVVIIQNSKGGGLSSTFGASSATNILGSRRSNEFIEKVTWYLAGGLALIAFVANVIGMTATTDERTLRMGQAIEEGGVYLDNATEIADPSLLQDNGGEEPAE
ncbi:MAG: preprotein translocase subunit SecG [Bacteroidota bacterium]